MAWEIKEHTKAKHIILKNYLAAWFPIMAFTNPRIVYFDGFAGPGRYTNGEDGSPIYALKIADELFQKHFDRLQHKEFVFVFIEQKKKHYESLKSEIKKLHLPDNFKVIVQRDEFSEVMVKLFSALTAKGKDLAPTFAFVDPFGTKCVPFDVIQQIMSYRKCEIFFNHMYSGVLRSAHVSDHTELYGTDDWKKCESPEDYTILYANQLQKVAGVRFTRSFNVRNRKNAHIFDLVYATNNPTGLSKMKEAMWKADPFGNFMFRDITNPNQGVLFELEPDISPLKAMLLNNFKGKTVSISDIENYVLVETPYLSGHIKNKTLQPMVKKGEITVKRPEGSKSGFKEGTLITFP